MSIQYKRAFYTMFLSGVLYIFLIVDFVLVGVNDFLNRTNFLLVALVILFAMIAFAGYMYVTNKTELVVDERDLAIQQKATSIALLATTMFVFLFLVGLFIAYEEQGFLPVSWMWLVAYLTFTVAYFSSSSIIVLLYWKDNADK